MDVLEEVVGADIVEVVEETPLTDLKRGGRRVSRPDGSRNPQTDWVGGPVLQDPPPGWTSG